MSTKKKYIIGTRGSLLALTQCKLIRDELENLTGDKFELEVIKTQGDLNTAVPLWQLDGKDFFTKELDEALLTKKVDLVVHSYKDLGSIRPDGIKLAAITERTFAHDILLINQSVKKDLKNIKEFIVGTSSPRRIVNIEKHLKDYIPHLSHDAVVKTSMLRGNVNTRIEKLKNHEYHAIVLAFAGLERLAQGPESKSKLEELLHDLDFFILPQTIFPSSASQGALAIECLGNRDDDGELLRKLSKVNHKITQEEVSRERKSFNEFGGGCHLAVGINVNYINDKFLHIHQGEVDSKKISVTTLEDPNRILVSENLKPGHIFIGMPESKSKEDPSVQIDKLILKEPYIEKRELEHAHFFVSTNYTIPFFEKNFKSGFIWASGTKTLKDLVKKGYWVNGSTDSLGEDLLEEFRDSELLKMFFKKDLNWFTLTASNATTYYGERIVAYKRTVQDVSPEYLADVTDCTYFYWTSFFQYKKFVATLPRITKNRVHCCGLGKTYRQFVENEIDVLPFAGLDEFKTFVNEINKNH